MKRYFSTLGAAALASGLAWAPAGAAPIAHREVLPNGIVLLVAERPAVPIVAVRVYMRAGSIYDPPDQAGLANLTGAVLTRGTAKRTGPELDSAIEFVGASLQAGASRDGLSVSLTAQKKDMTLGLDLLSEVVLTPAFPEAEFEQLRQERIAGAELTRSDPQAIAQLNLLRHLSPYSKGDLRYVPAVDERIEALKAVTLDDLKRFHREFFGASNAELAVSGDFDAEVVRRLVGELFGDWKGTKAFADTFRPYRELSPSNQTFDTPDKANAMVGAGMRFRLGDQDPDYPAMVLANYMLGGHSSSRLYDRIRGKDGLSYSVGSSLATLPGDNAADFMVFAITAPENASKVETAMKEELQRALKEGFPADEVAGAKKGWIQTQEVSRSQDPELVGRLRLQLHSNRTMAFDIDLEKKIEALTPDQILTALRRHLDVSQLSFVKAGDFKKAGGK